MWQEAVCIGRVFGYLNTLLELVCEDLWKGSDIGYCRVVQGWIREHSN